MANTRRRLAVAAANRMAFLSASGKVQVWDGKAWKRTATEPANLVDVAIGPSGIWAVDSAGIIHQFDEPSQTWRKDSKASNVETLATDQDGNIWCVNTKGEFYSKPRTVSVNLTGDWKTETRPS